MRKDVVPILLILTVLMGTASLIGCGGSKTEPRPSAATPSATGRATLTVRWPERSRLIPFASESVKVRLTRGEALLGEKLLTRPANGGNASATFERLPIGAALVQAWAYPNADGSGVAQAQGQVGVNVEAGKTTDVGLTLGSTIDHLEITPSTPTPLTVGATLALSATARNAGNDMVLTSTSKVEWHAQNPEIATVDPAGLVTAVAPGQAAIQVTETESGKTAALTLTIVPGASPTPTPTPTPTATPTPGPGIQFTAPTVYNVPGISNVICADIDGDGNLDLIAGTGNIVALFGHGDGTFADPVTLYDTGANLEASAVADINGDGRLDIVVISQNSTIISLINQGNRTFINGGMTSLPGINTLDAGDLTGDGKPDLATIQQGDGGSGNFKVLKNNGDNTFTVIQDQRIIGIPEGAMIKDLNNDGKLDVVVTFETSIVGRSGFSTFFNNGTGNFTADAEYDNGTGNMPMVAFADFNKDGKIDIVNANYWGHALTFYSGDGTGKFVNPTVYPAPPYPLVIRVADFDRDGWPDVVASNAGSNHFSVLRNKQDGAFDERLEILSGGENTRGCVIGDFNKDGKTDVAFGCESSQSITVLLNATP